jgi:hypothetical protein
MFKQTLRRSRRMQKLNGKEMLEIFSGDRVWIVKQNAVGRNLCHFSPRLFMGKGKEIIIYWRDVTKK